MEIGLLDIVSYPVWKLWLMLLGIIAISYLYGWIMAYEKINERKR